MWGACAYLVGCYMHVGPTHWLTYSKCGASLVLRLVSMLILTAWHNPVNSFFLCLMMVDHVSVHHFSHMGHIACLQTVSSTMKWLIIDMGVWHPCAACFSTFVLPFDAVKGHYMGTSFWKKEHFHQKRTKYLYEWFWWRFPWYGTVDLFWYCM